MTTIQYRPASYTLTVTGHAGAARRGEDLVCAGLSTLCWSLKRAAEAVPGYRAAGQVDESGPRFTLRCRPALGLRGRCRAVLEAAAAGFGLLAEEFPDYVKLEVER